MKLWVDADAAPREVKEVIFKASRRLQMATVLVANQPMWTPPGATTISTRVVREGADQADRYIVVHAQPGDAAVSADVPLAALLVDKGVRVIDPRGDEYTPDNIRERLAMRNFMDSLRGAGQTTRGAAPYSAQDKKAFAAALDRVLTQLIKQHRQSP